MSNSLLTPSVIAKEGLRQLKNNCVTANLVYRGYEQEFGTETYTGNKPGDTVSIRRPVKYQVRDGAVMDLQDTTEGKVGITVNKQKGVDISFKSSDMTLSISDFSKRYIEPAMIQLANQVDQDILDLYKSVWNWAGTAGQVINSFSDFGKGPQRLDEMAVPQEMRRGVLSPADHWAMLGTFSGLYIQDTAKSALQRAKLPMVGGVDLYMAQNVRTHTVGALGGTPLVKGASQDVTYLASKDTNTQTLLTDGWSNSITGVVKAGDVFTLDDVYAVNPVSKDAQTYLQQFTITADADSDSGGNASLTISPAIITSGPYQTVSAAPDNDAGINMVGTAATGYRQNMVFHENAFALCMVPMELPEGATRARRETYDGFSVRVIPFYDGINDVSKWRFDILYGVKAIYPELATRLSGTSG